MGRKQKGKKIDEQEEDPMIPLLQFGRERSGGLDDLLLCLNSIQI